MDRERIHTKFGGDYVATERTYTLGIDQRLAKHIAQRFCGHRVLETCTGGGFTTIALARVAAHVVTIEIDQTHQDQARRNVKKAGLLDRVTFVTGDALSDDILHMTASIDAAFLDPDWAADGPGHIYRFRESNMRPPADQLLERAFRLTRNVAIILPPQLDLSELQGLPEHERQSLYLANSHELYCLYFGNLALKYAVTELHV